jgi:putative ABC transport system ATP-binding protein
VIFLRDGDLVDATAPLIGVDQLLSGSGR